MAWELDPDFALQSRLSFGRGGRYAWAALAGALFIGFGGVSGSIDRAQGLAQAGAFLVLAALPYGAIRVRSLERDGHFDMRRLTGRSPLWLGVALVAGSGWALSLAAVGLLFAGGAAGFAFPALTIAALTAMGLAMALLVLLMPAGPDSSILMILLALGSVSTVHVMRDDRGVALGTLIVSGIICPWALPATLRRFRRASQHDSDRALFHFGAAGRLRVTSQPEFYRVLAANPLIVPETIAALLVTPVLMWWILRVSGAYREVFVVLILYVPLVLAGYEAGTLARRDAIGTAIDCVRLTNPRAWRVVTQMAGAAALTSVVGSLAAAGVLVAMDRRRAMAFLAWWPIAAVLWIFGGLAEGLRLRKPAGYLAALLPLTFLIVTSSGGPVAGLFAAAVAVAVAAGSLVRPELPPARRTTAVIVSALIGATAVAVASHQLEGAGLLVAGFASLAAGLFVFDNAPRRTRLSWACGAAAAIACGLSALSWIPVWWFSFQARVFFTRSGHVFALPGRGSALYHLIIAAYGGCGLLFGWFAHNQYGSTRLRSSIVRSIPLIVAGLAVVTAGTVQADALVSRVAVSTGYYAPAIVEVLLLVIFASVTLMLGVRDWREWRASGRPQ